MKLSFLIFVFSLFISKQAAPSRQSIVFTGDACDFVDFGAVRNLGSSCSDGSKMVLKHSPGNRKQFLIADSRTIYAFVPNGQKFPTCTSFSDKTCDVQCKAIDGLGSVSLSRSNSKHINGRVYTGNDCDWVDLNKVSDNSDCDNGDKFVLKNRAGVNRRQFLFVDGKTILAFVPKGKKFTECSSYTEVTTQVDCKPVDGASSISLPKCDECENGFKKWQNKCYLYLEEEQDWDYVSQPDICHYWSYKSQLVSIHSQEENDYVYSLFNYKSGLNAWTGGYLNPTTGAWAWLDGSSFDYSNWASGEPNGAAPQSLMMYGKAGAEPGKWIDELPTTRVVGFVCAYNLFENNG